MIATALAATAAVTGTEFPKILIYSLQYSKIDQLVLNEIGFLQTEALQNRKTTQNKLRNVKVMSIFQQKLHLTLTKNAFLPIQIRSTMAIWKVLRDLI